MQIKKTGTYIVTLLAALLLLVNLPTHSNSSIRFLHQILKPENGLILRALFSPKDDIRQTIINLIDNEQQAIKIASYFFTDSAIANALIKAHKKAVDIQIITDQKHLETCPHTKIFDLYKNNINIAVFKNQTKGGIFHHKFIWFAQNFTDQPILITGSFNFTSAAQEQNQENVIISNDLKITSSYLEHFLDLKQQSQPISKFIKQQKLKFQ